MFFVVSLCCFACTGNKYAGVPERYHALLDEALDKAGKNAVELKEALRLAPEAEKEGIAYQIAYMPLRDLKTVNTAFLLINTSYAYKARERYPWAKALPDSIFLNEVLPYASLNERREAWRPDFYQRFDKYVEGCSNIFEAIEAVNRNIRDEVQVDYNTRREKPDQSPFESMRQHMASCTGLSILLTDAFRAVGIPSRVAGTPNWHDERGNHNWTEVWADGKWYFTEYYYPGQLDNAWFFADAGQAVKGDREKAIYASSFKPTGISFPLVWNEKIQYVAAENVTDRYTDLYKEHLASISQDGNHVPLRIMAFKDKRRNTQSEDRVATNLDVFCGKLQMGGGRTSGPTQDMNDVLTFMLEKNRTYTVSYVAGNGEMKQVTVTLKDRPQELKLYME